MIEKIENKLEKVIKSYFPFPINLMYDIHCTSNLGKDNRHDIDYDTVFADLPEGCSTFVSNISSVSSFDNYPIVILLYDNKLYGANFYDVRNKKVYWKTFDYIGKMK